MLCGERPRRRNWAFAAWRPVAVLSYRRNRFCIVLWCQNQRNPYFCQGPCKLSFWIWARLLDNFDVFRRSLGSTPIALFLMVGVGWLLAALFLLYCLQGIFPAPQWQSYLSRRGARSPDVSFVDFVSRVAGFPWISPLGRLDWRNLVGRPAIHLVVCLNSVKYSQSFIICGLGLLAQWSNFYKPVYMQDQSVVHGRLALWSSLAIAAASCRSVPHVSCCHLAGQRRAKSMGR